MPRDIDGIIDDIDRLVDEQMQQEASGYDRNLNVQKCPHCDGEWHGLAMGGCPGSDFIGPPVPWGDFDMKARLDNFQRTFAGACYRWYVPESDPWLRALRARYTGDNDDALIIGWVSHEEGEQ